MPPVSIRAAGRQRPALSRGASGEGLPGGAFRPGLLRAANAQEILRLLRVHTPCSRADLVRYSGLSAPTVSSAIAYLQRKNLVQPLGLGASSGGRPPNLLRFNARFGYVAGADIGGSAVRVALADLDGAILGKWSASTRAHRTPERIMALVAAGVRELQRQHKIPSRKLLALAAGAPGITDVRAGIVLSAPHLSRWHNVPLRQALETRLGVPTVVENDVNLGALGESWMGAARREKNFVFLALGTGIGAGIFIDGRLYHGSDWSAGEVGYMHVPGTPESALEIDRPGSLEKVIGGEGIVRSWRVLCKKNGASRGRRGLPAQPTQIFERAAAGDAAARALLHRASRILADAILNLSVVLNSSLVVLGGGIGTSLPLFEATRRSLERHQFARPRLAQSLLGPEAQLCGAVRLALDHAEARIMGW